MPDTPPAQPTPDPQPPDRDAIRTRAEELRAAFLSAASGYDGSTSPNTTAIEKLLNAEQAMFDYAVDHYRDLDDLDWVEDVHNAHLADLAQAVLDAGKIPLTDAEIHTLAVDLASLTDGVTRDHRTGPKLSDEEMLRDGLHDLLDIPEPGTFDVPTDPDPAPGL